MQGGYIPSEWNTVETGADNVHSDVMAQYNTIMYSVRTPPTSPSLSCIPFFHFM